MTQTKLDTREKMQNVQRQKKLRVYQNKNDLRESREVGGEESKGKRKKANDMAGVVGGCYLLRHTI